MVELGGTQAISSKVQSLEKSLEVLKELIINIKEIFKSKKYFRVGESVFQVSTGIVLQLMNIDIFFTHVLNYVQYFMPSFFSSLHCTHYLVDFYILP